MLRTLIVATLSMAHCGKDPAAPATMSDRAALEAMASVERLLDAGRHAEALRAAETLQRARARDPLAAEMLGRARMAAGASPASIAEAFAMAADLDPVSPGLQSAAGVTAAATGSWSEALRRAEAASRLQPGNPQHDFHRAIALRRLGRSRDALQAARTVRQRLPMDPAVRIELAECELACGDVDAALADARAAVALERAAAATRVAAADVARRCGALDDAVALLMPLVGSGEPSVLVAVAECHGLAGRHDESARWWERAAAAPAAGWMACAGACRAHAAAGDTRQALAWLAACRERGAPAWEVEALERHLALPRVGDLSK
ncbi:MAG: tetratricopeptide repeat protein [Phycisphaerales bacterium]